MKKLLLNRETLRKLDDATMEQIIGGKKETTIGWCQIETSCVNKCKVLP